MDISSDYNPQDQQKTIYYLNHHSWWDGLIPFLLNRKLFRQNARGMMEDKQLHQHSFFRRIGVFSINLTSSRSSMRSMRYAVESMKRQNAALYIYPQGKIEPFKTEDLSFQNGVGWLAKQVPQADLVPVGIHIHTLDSDKPTLFIKVGSPSNVDRSKSSEYIKNRLENELSDILFTLI